MHCIQKVIKIGFQSLLKQERRYIASNIIQREFHSIQQINNSQKNILNSRITSVKEGLNLLEDRNLLNIEREEISFQCLTIFTQSLKNTFDYNFYVALIGCAYKHQIQYEGLWELITNILVREMSNLSLKQLLEINNLSIPIYSKEIEESCSNNNLINWNHIKLGELLHEYIMSKINVCVDNENVERDIEDIVKGLGVVSKLPKISKGKYTYPWVMKYKDCLISLLGYRASDINIQLDLIIYILSILENKQLGGIKYVKQYLEEIVNEYSMRDICSTQLGDLLNCLLSCKGDNLDGIIDKLLKIILERGEDEVIQILLERVTDSISIVEQEYKEWILRIYKEYKEYGNIKGDAIESEGNTKEPEMDNNNEIVKEWVRCNRGDNIDIGIGILSPTPYKNISTSIITYLQEDFPPSRKIPYEIIILELLTKNLDKVSNCEFIQILDVSAKLPDHLMEQIISNIYERLPDFSPGESISCFQYLVGERITEDTEDIYNIYNIYNIDLFPFYQHLMRNLESYSRDELCIFFDIYIRIPEEVYSKSTEDKHRIFTFDLCSLILAILLPALHDHNLSPNSMAILAAALFFAPQGARWVPYAKDVIMLLHPTLHHVHHLYLNRLLQAIKHANLLIDPKLNAFKKHLIFLLGELKNN